MNLFLNSAQAGAKNIRIQARGLEIVVSDDGPGIAPELLPRIFQAARVDEIDHLGAGVVRGAIDRRAERRKSNGRQRAQRRRGIHDAGLESCGFRVLFDPVGFDPAISTTCATLCPWPNFRAPARQLQHASGIGRDDVLRAGCVHGFHLFSQQRHRHAGMNNVVDTRAAAAQIG